MWLSAAIICVVWSVRCRVGTLLKWFKAYFCLAFEKQTNKKTDVDMNGTCGFIWNSFFCACLSFELWTDTDILWWVNDETFLYKKKGKHKSGWTGLCVCARVWVCACVCMHVHVYVRGALCPSSCGPKKSQWQWGTVSLIRCYFSGQPHMLFLCKARDGTASQRPRQAQISQHPLLREHTRWGNTR